MHQGIYCTHGRLTNYIGSVSSMSKFRETIPLSKPRRIITTFLCNKFGVICFQQRTSLSTSPVRCLQIHLAGGQFGDLERALPSRRPAYFFPRGSVHPRWWLLQACDPLIRPMNWARRPLRRQIRRSSVMYQPLSSDLGNRIRAGPSERHKRVFSTPSLAYKLSVQTIKHFLCTAQKLCSAYISTTNKQSNIIFSTRTQANVRGHITTTGLSPDDSI